MSNLRRLAAVSAAAAVLVAAAIAVSSSGSEKTSPPATTQPSTLFTGFTERDGVLGDPGAPVTLTEYVDLQCPVCARAASTTLPAVVEYVRAGKVKLAARTLHFLGPDSVRAARVAAGAERQGRLWPFLEAFYARQGTENSGYATDDFLREVAEVAGVDADRALAAADTDFATRRLERANADAARMGVQGTPTLTVRRGDGPEQPLDADPLDPASVAAALDAEAAR